MVKVEGTRPFDSQPRLPSGAAVSSPPKCGSPYRPNLKFHSIFFLFYYTKQGKKYLSVKLPPQIYSPGLRFLLLGKYTHTLRTLKGTHTHTPDKTPENYLSHKSPFQAEGQGSFKDAPVSFPFIYIFFSGAASGRCVYPGHGQHETSPHRFHPRPPLPQLPAADSPVSLSLREVKGKLRTRNSLSDSVHRGR